MEENQSIKKETWKGKKSVLKKTEILYKQMGHSEERIMKIKWKLEEAEKRFKFLQEALEAAKEKYTRQQKRRADIVRANNYNQWEALVLIKRGGRIRIRIKRSLR